MHWTDLPTRVFGVQHGFKATGENLWSRDDGRLHTLLVAGPVEHSILVTCDGFLTLHTRCATVHTCGRVDCDAHCEAGGCMNCGTPCYGTECGQACAALLRNDNVFQ
jgi:hypothetical protein